MWHLDSDLIDINIDELASNKLKDKNYLEE